MTVRRSGSGPQLVYLHGLGEWSVSFDPLVARPELAGFTHVLPDLPGYGRSAWPDELPEGDSLAWLAARIAGWLAGKQPAVLVGHSMGGVLATLVAELLPVRAIVNLDGNLTRGDCTFSARAAAEPYEAFVAGGFERMRHDVFVAGAGDPALRGYFAALSAASPAMFHRNATDLVRASEREELGPRLAALSVPRIVLAGVPGGLCERSREQLDRLGLRWQGLEPSRHWGSSISRRRVAQVIATIVPP